MKSIRRINFPILPNMVCHNLRVAAYCRVSTKHDEQQRLSARKAGGAEAAESSQARSGKVE